MGMVIKQGFFNSVWMFLGIVVGYINTVLLFPIFLTADQFGLTRVLWAAGSVFAQFALLGGPQVLIKFFPEFNKKPRERGGFFTLMLLIPLLGFAIFFLAGTIFKSAIVNSYATQSNLFADNFTYLFAITFFLIYFAILESYLRALFKTTVAAFLKNVMLRILWLGLIILYQQKLIGFETFIFWFVNAYGIILFTLIIYALTLKQLKISFKMNFLTTRQIRTMGEFGLYVILGGSTAYLANYIDVLMVGGMINLKNVAFYSVAFYLGAVVLLPFNGTGNILMPVISEGFAKKDMNKVADVYRQSSINLSLISMLIFLGIWLNANDIFKILPPEYASGKYVLLFIALAKLFGSTVGVNGFVLQYSPHFRILLWSNVAFLALVVVSNYLLIPPLGITGAALATFLSQILVNIFQISFIYIKMKIHPFQPNNLKIIISGGIVFLGVFFIPSQNNVTVDIIFRSVIIIVLYLPLAYFWKASPEYKDFVDKWVKKIF